MGYNDHKIIWFDEGVVTGITSYKSSRSGCTGALKTIKWEDAPDVVIETRDRELCVNAALIETSSAYGDRGDHTSLAY